MEAWAAGLQQSLGGETLAEVGKLALAFVLSALIGVEREWRSKSAGIRTHTLVGLGSALFMLISKYGFWDIINRDLVVLDPSRMAAQIVSGIGFIGAGLIFVRRDAVHGLTTAAGVWVVAAVGAAAGAGLPLLATAVTAGHFLAVIGLSPIARLVSRRAESRCGIRIDYLHGSGALRRALDLCERRGFAVSDLSTVRRVRPAEPEEERRRERGEEPHPEVATASMVVLGRGSVTSLIAELIDVPGVVAARADAPDATTD